MRPSESKNRVGVMSGVFLLAATLGGSAQESLQSPRGEEVFGSLTVLPPRTVRIDWDYPVILETPDLVFKLYGSTNLSGPVEQWELITNVPGHLRSVLVLAEQEQEFFTLTASNFLGESGYARD